MTHDWRFTAEKIGKRIELIRPLAFRARLPINPFKIHRLPDAETDPPLDSDTQHWPEVPWDSYWAGQNEHYLLSSGFSIPSDWAMGQIALHLPMGVAGDIFTHPESLIYIDGEAWASADRYHHTIYLDPAVVDGQPHRLELHGWTGLTNWPPDFNDPAKLLMRPCSVVDIDEATRDFIALAEAALDVSGQIDGTRSEKSRLLNALDAAFREVDTRDPLGNAFYESVPAALETLKEELGKAGSPLDVRLHAIGHAHMDIAYLWPISQVRRKNARTYSNVLRLMERFPDYRFSHSQPQLYEYTQQDYPDLFRAISDRVAEGRWEVMGGFWVEADTNIPGGESLVRQLLLGRTYFSDAFGEVETPVLWLPDVFGLSWCLPQLIKQAGLRWVLSNKFSWNQYNPIPASTLWWQGIDGTRVLTHFLTTPRTVQHLPFPTNYKSDLSAKEVLGTWERSTVKDRISDLPITYGYGDGGGGPTDALIRRANAYDEMPGAPRIRLSTAREFFETIEAQSPELSVWNDEFYLEGHRGVLTSQGWLKRANRRAESQLHEIEFLAVLALLNDGDDLPLSDLTDAWKLLCLNQFHDILPGTSVTEVFDDARKDFQRIGELTDSFRRSALNRLERSGGSREIVVVNALPFQRDRQVFVSDELYPDFNPNGSGQKIEGGTLVHMKNVDAYSLAPLRTDSPRQAVSVEQGPDGITIENGEIAVFIGMDGRINRIFDKTAQRDVLESGANGNILQVFEDRPISWDAWDIDPFFEDRCETIDSLTMLTVIEAGPLRAGIIIERSFRSSLIQQTIRLAADSRRIDFDTQIDWRESHLLLKAAFPVAVLNPTATYEIQWGSIERPTHRNTSWDYAKFEVPAQKWADLSEGDYGVALLNNGKYGYDIRDNVIRLSLIKSATMPDPQADQGHHGFTYSLLPHAGDWRNGVIPEAYALNMPTKAIAGTRVSDGMPMGSLVSTDSETVVLETIKPAQNGNGFIVRLYESHRSRGPVTLTFGLPMHAVSICNLLEQDSEPVTITGGTVVIDVKPFEIVSLRCIPKVGERPEPH